jgi:hypothetical protein
VTITAYKYSPLHRLNSKLLSIIQQSNQSINPTPHSLPNPTNQTHQTTKMAFFKSLIIASVAAVVIAAPSGGASDKNTDVNVDSQSGKPVCGNGQKIACCNSGEDLIGLNCLSVPIRKLFSRSYPG